MKRVVWYFEDNRDSSALHSLHLLDLDYEEGVWYFEDNRDSSGTLHSLDLLDLHYEEGGVVL